MRAIDDGEKFIKSYCPEPSPLGAAVANLLDVWQNGLYHMDVDTLRKADWKSTYVIRIKLSRGSCLSTWDFADLTHLVVLCHDRLMRCQISASGNKLELMFHQRKARTGDMAIRHPSIEEHLKEIRAHMSQPIDAEPVAK